MSDIGKTPESVIREYYGRTHYYNRGARPISLREQLNRHLGYSDHRAKKTVVELLDSGVLLKIGAGSGARIQLREQYEAAEAEKQHRIALRVELKRRLSERGFRYEAGSDEHVIGVPVSALCRALGIENPYDAAD